MSYREELEKSFYDKLTTVDRFGVKFTPELAQSLAKEMADHVAENTTASQRCGCCGIVEIEWVG